MRRSFGSLLLCGAVLLSVSAASAAERCKGIGNSLEIVVCLQSEYEEHERELNQAYQEVEKRLVPQDAADRTDYGAAKENLVRAQEYWRRFVDEDCAGLYRLAEGGTGRNAVELGCHNRHMKQRIQELHQWGYE